MKIIGKGSFAEVYIGKFNNVDVAIKHNISDKKTHIERFKEECIILQSLSHPNILKHIYHDDKFLYTDLFDCDLSKIMFDTHIDEDMHHIMLDVAKGLNYIHNLPDILIHRDVKPENILVQRSSHAVLCDFGFAIKLGKDNPEKVYTNQIKTGSLIFMAYEIIVPTISKYSTASDIWAFGITYWHFINKCEPYLDLKNPEEYRTKIQSGYKLDFKNVQDGNKDLFNMIEKTLLTNPSDRPTAKQFVDFLTRITETSNKRKKISE